MLQVSKEGATVLGRGLSFQYLLSTTISVPAASPDMPSRTRMLLKLSITQLPDSVRCKSCALILVCAISSICSIWRYIASEHVDSLWTRIRSGRGSLHVTIGGCGNLISTPKRGESDWVGGSSGPRNAERSPIILRAEDAMAGN